MTYQQRKNAARNRAIEWQADFGNHPYTWGELADWQAYFERLGRRYGLFMAFAVEKAVKK